MSKLKSTMQKNRLAAALTATFLLAGCTLGPDYVRPASTLPEQTLETSSEARAQAPLNPEWWTLFNDASRNNLVGQALAANQDLQAAIACLEAAEAAAREAGPVDDQRLPQGGPRIVTIPARRRDQLVEDQRLPRPVRSLVSECLLHRDDPAPAQRQLQPKIGQAEIPM